MNRTHTFVGVDDANIVAAIAAMISTFGTQRGNNCVKFGVDGPNRFTLVWRMTDRTHGSGVSFRKGSDEPDRAYYRTSCDAAEAIHEASTHRLPSPRMKSRDPWGRPS